MHSTRSESSLQLSMYSPHFLPYSFSSNVNIVSYKESFLDDQTSTLCIVMDLADGGDLQTKINNCKKMG